MPALTPRLNSFREQANKVFDGTEEKPTAVNTGDTQADRFEERDTRICTGLQYASTLGLHLHLESLDPATRKIFSTTLNAAHYDIVHTALELLNEKGVVFSSLDGEILQITIRFVKNPLEDA